MDFFKFVNSSAIRKHLKRINYEFSGVEATLVVWHSDYYSIDEKHRAWKYIVENISDENISKSQTPFFNEEYGISIGLHEFLQQFIDYEDEILKHAMTNYENTFFTFKMYYADDDSSCEDQRIFTNVEKLMHAIDEEISHMSEFELKWVWIKKHWGDCEKYVEVQLNSKKDVYNIYSYNIFGEEEFDLYNIMENMYLELPTPFKKGDILYKNSIFGKGDPFVFKNLTCEDMIGYGYLMTEDGRIFMDHISDYLSFEYYDEPLNGVYRILTALSNYFKNKIDICLLLEAYSIISYEERTNLQKKYLGVPDEYVELAGLKTK